MLLPDHFVLPLKVKKTKPKVKLSTLNAIPIFKIPANYYSGKFFLSDSTIKYAFITKYTA